MKDETQKPKVEQNIFRRFFAEDFTFTKRMLGIIMLVVGVVGVVGILAIDLLRAGQEGGIGPAQQLALGLMILTALVGASLIPLGDDPA